MAWSPYQLDIFNSFENTNSNLVISAGPGSGKTSTLLELLKRKKPHRKAIFLAFNDSIAKELKRKVPFGVDASTIHSYGAKMLFKYFNGDVDIKPNKVFTFAIKFLKEWGLDKNKKKFEHLGTVSELVNLYRLYLCNNSVDLREISDYHGVTCLNGEIDHSIELINTLHHYNKYGDDNGKRMIDFTDMIYLPVTIEDMEFTQYDEVLVDEGQDLNISQQLMVKKILKKNGRFVLVGDPFQSIYSFLGADTESFNNFKKESNTIELPLSISYRCPKKVVEKANSVYNVIQPFEQNEDGEVRDGSIDEVANGDFILCRNNKPLVEAYIYLLINGKKAYIKGKNLGDGILKLVSKVEDKTLSEGMRILKDLLNEIYLDLRNNGVAKPGNHPRYVSLFEKVEIIDILTEKYLSFKKLTSILKEMFVDDIKDGITLSTIHKAKGLESNNVFILRRELIPSQYAEKGWEIEQEQNLLYVAYTRSKNRLIFITDF